MSMVMNFSTMVLRYRSGRLSAAAQTFLCRDFVFSLESICFSVPGSRLAVLPGLPLARRAARLEGRLWQVSVLLPCGSLLGLDGGRGALRTGKKKNVLVKI